MGIIPARAGFTASNSVSAGRSRDHPRSRGVYGRNVRARPELWGSSPLARGLLVLDRRAELSGRIIPARAGFTAGRPGSGGRRRDHPRSRGVYERQSCDGARDWGSSPLARGLLERRRPHSQRWRIIPARAGFTTLRRASDRRIRDHPRSRGVYNGERRVATFKHGSSPLARGLHLRILGIPTMSHTTRPRLPSLPT